MTATIDPPADLRAPFPWFGGKRRVAADVWAALGDVDNYVEPFFGSGAVLLERPDRHTGRTETVNDKDRYVANFWRALTHAPDEVAAWADWPVNEADLEARHLWLVNTGADRIAAMFDDPDFYDAKVAGWWVWGICSWIGSGWCSGKGPHLGDGGQGVNRQLPHLGDGGQGVNRKLPHLGDGGQGINRKHGDLAGYLAGLADRLRNTRIICGDWTRVVTNGALHYGGTVGIFLDPPYLGTVRRNNLYATDDHTIADDVREWSITNGNNPRYRIVLAGYTPEHDHHIPDTWRRHHWTTKGSYSTTASAGTNHNRELECLWMSPHCHNPTPNLFDQ